MMVRLPPLRIAQTHRRNSLRCRPNESAVVALLPVRPDGSGGKLGSRLAYARAGVADRFCGRTRQCRRTMGPRPAHGCIEANWNRFGIATNQVWFDEARPLTPANSAAEMVSKRSTTIGGSDRRWRESRCSGPWCRGRTSEQSGSSLNGQIPSTIPTNTSDGVSKCSSTLASGASGLKMGAAAPRLRPSIGCSRITSKSFATAALRSTLPTVNVSAVPTTPARPCKPGRTDKILAEGGRGFNSLEGSRPVTAPDLMRRFFSCPRTFDYFYGNQIIQTMNLQFAQVNQCGLDIRSALYSIYFLGVFGRRSRFEKTSRNSRGGGGTP
jgi:hypothetical protein